MRLPPRRLTGADSIDIEEASGIECMRTTSPISALPNAGAGLGTIRAASIRPSRRSTTLAARRALLSHAQYKIRRPVPLTINRCRIQRATTPRHRAGRKRRVRIKCFRDASGYFCGRARRGTPLYSAAAKFESGCGWPAFSRCYVDALKCQPDLEQFESSMAAASSRSRARVARRIWVTYSLRATTLRARRNDIA